MFLKKNKIPTVFLLISIFMLCQCTTGSDSPIEVNQKPASVSPKSPSDYPERANAHEGNEQANALIKTAGRLIYKGQWRQGVAILAQTNELTADQLNEKHLLLAKTELMQDRYKAALAQLTKINDPEQLSTAHQVHYHEIMAQSYHAENNLTSALSQRIKLDHLLVDENSQKSNQQKLWHLLTNLSQDELDTLSAETSNNLEQQGWLQLQTISRNYRTNPQALLTALAQWKKQFNHHSGHQILPNSLESIANKIRTQPQKIALLLPLTGPLSGPGKAIQEGFMAAYEANQPETAIQVKAYDTNKGDINEIYQTAIDAGSDYVVGPLTKNDVASIAAISHPVPTLLLNDSDAILDDNSYLFGLSPLNEATQVAIKARSKGYGRVLIIAPKNDWGHDIAAAFERQWKEQGGQITDTLLYSPNQEMNQAIRDFLHITDSQEREKKLKERLGRHIQYSISRRQDFDVIFLLAYPSNARQIMPLLNYYYAGDIPVYATSSVYSGNANALKDKDLDGMIFCDIPWVFAHQMGTKNWPEQFNSYNRLYAMGKDSYALATQLNQLILFPADGSMKANGTLYLKSSHQVARVLEWGQFKHGLARSLGEA